MISPFHPADEMAAARIMTPAKFAEQSGGKLTIGARFVFVSIDEGRRKYVWELREKPLAPAFAFRMTKTYPMNGAEPGWRIEK